VGTRKAHQSNERKTGTKPIAKHGKYIALNLRDARLASSDDPSLLAS
jgi:hypothetical protein